jgi:hypothetical protein
MKMHSPGADPDDSTDGFQVQVGTSSIELTLFPQAEGAGSVSSGVVLGWDTYLSNSYLSLSSPSAEDAMPRIDMEVNAASETATMTFGFEVVDGVPRMEFSTDVVAGSSQIQLSSQSDGGHTAVAMTADDALAQLTLINGDPIGPPSIVVRATADGGGQIGINTDSPAEALDVNGTTQTTGFKMPTDADDGHVLTSDGSGNGTWQAPGSGGSKAACADMYEGMTNGSSQVTITFPVTFDAPPYFSVTGLIKSAGQAGKMAHVVVSSLTTTGVTLTIQYWDSVIFDNIGGSIEMLLSYTAIEK